MKNFEKYEKEIKEALRKDLLFTTSIELSHRNMSRYTDIVIWLYEEYKEFEELNHLCSKYEKALDKAIDSILNRETNKEENAFTKCLWTKEQWKEWCLNDEKF